MWVRNEAMCRSWIWHLYDGWMQWTQTTMQTTTTSVAAVETSSSSSTSSPSYLSTTPVDRVAMLMGMWNHCWWQLMMARWSKEQALVQYNWCWCHCHCHWWRCFDRVESNYYAWMSIWDTMKYMQNDEYVCWLRKVAYKIKKGVFGWVI